MAEKRARVTRIVELAPSVRLVEAESIEPPALGGRPGQFISVRCDGEGAERRSYTLATAPAAAATEPGRFELLVKDVPGGVGTAFFAALAAGDELRFTGPMGFFVADPAHAGDVVLIATGAGIAAALPVAEEIAARPAERERVRLHWGLLDDQPSYYGERLAALPHHRIIRAGDWPALHAALEQVAVQAVDAASSQAKPVFYLVGNGDMCKRVKDALVARGVDRRRGVHSEQFYPVFEGRP